MESEKSAASRNEYFNALVNLLSDSEDMRDAVVGCEEDRL